MAAPSLQDMRRKREAAKEDAAAPAIRACIVANLGTCGLAAGAMPVLRAFGAALESSGAADVRIVVSGCAGLCSAEPMATVELRDAPPVRYAHLTPEKAHRIFTEHVLGGHAVEEDTLDPQLPFFSRQRPVVLRNVGRIDPERIDDYLARDGYSALEKVLTSMNPEQVIEEVSRSGLRGRGGAGFPAGRKWKACRAEERTPRYVVGNCDEGDPGAYMDRSLLESDPHAVIEGMTIAAYAVGAENGYLYVRSEYPLAIRTMHVALQQARAYGLLGRDILGSGFDLEIGIREGSGAFVCGEETSLLRSIEGAIPEPRQRPPFPAQSGLWGCPTVINNVETLANVPVILLHGAEEYASVGTPTSKGTKVFSLVGKINNTGLIEVPMGLPLREIVYEIGGGIPGGKKLKAVQTGGPSGGCLPASLMDLPLDYESLSQAGSIMGSGGMIVIDEETCVVDLARYFLQFTNDESCGKCTSCRDGSAALLEVLTRIAAGEGRDGDLEFLEELGSAVKDASMCGLGQTLPNPVLSTLRHFRDEYERHLKDKRCDAFVCPGLVGAPCQAACPLGTEAWRYVAHIGRGEYEQAYRVIREANPFPSVCARVCNSPCESRCRAGASGTQSVAIRALKRFITDRIDPFSYRPLQAVEGDAEAPRVAVIGAGPAGLTCAHYLSLAGIEVTVFESENEPGGMLFSAIPSYRLPREVVRREIASLLDDNVTLRCNSTLGREISLEGLLGEGFRAVFVALGAHKSLALGLPGEDAAGVMPAIRFLKAFNLHGEALARGRVGVVGGGNSAVDAARMALRQGGVDSVTILYRRSRAEMLAFAEEVEAAIEEGVRLEELVQPVRIATEGGRLVAVEFARNRLGDPDASGRRRPFPIPGSEHLVELDTLLVAISEGSDTDCVAVAGVERLETTRGGMIKVDPVTMMTNRPGVFAGGDVVTGPNTVVDAIAAGKRAAAVIRRYLAGEPLAEPAAVRLPSTYVAPVEIDSETAAADRVATPRMHGRERSRSFDEVEQAFTTEEATREALRCLRCDLAFTEKLGPRASAEGGTS